MPTYLFKERVILRGYAWRQRLRRPPILGFPDAFRQTERLLICLPGDPDEAQRAVTVIPGLIACLQAKMVTIAGTATSTAACDSLSVPMRVVPISTDDRKWSGLPTADLVARVTGDGLNIVIDLNPQMDVLIATLCLQTGAQLRLCFREPYRELFFNVQIAISFDESPSPVDTDNKAAVLATQGQVESGQNIDGVISESDHESDLISVTPYTRFLHTVKGMMGKAEG